MSEGEKDGPRKKDWEQKDGGQKTRHDARIHPSPPPKQLVKAWALQITTSCSHFSLQLQAHFKFLPSHSPSVPQSPPPTANPPSGLFEDTHCQVCHSPFDEEKMLLCDTCNAQAGWHLDCLVPPLLVVPLPSWSCPLCSTPPSSPLPSRRSFNVPSPILQP